MGMLRALVDSAARFKDEDKYRELAVGFDYRPINWIIEFDLNSSELTLKGPYKEEMIRSVPMRADRSGKVSKNNIKPNLFADNARYALGLAEGTTTGDAFSSFLKLHEAALENLKVANESDTNESIERAKKVLGTILAFLNLSTENRHEKLEMAKREEPLPVKNENQRKKRVRKTSKQKLPDSNDLITFAFTDHYPFDSEHTRRFWKEHLQRICSDQNGVCSVCCEDQKPLLRILPFKVRLFGERCPILSVNTDEQQSFGSLGKVQLGNSPICMECAGEADRLLKFLTLLDKDEEGKEKNSGRHAIVLSREKQALGNQIAVFWTKEQVSLNHKDGESLTFEDLAKMTLEDFDNIPEEAPPVRDGQMRKMLELPFAGGNDNSVLPANRFYLAVLSPNKSRLVVREWLDTDVEFVRQNVKRYMDALRIVHPDGRGIWSPPLKGLLESLNSYTSLHQKTKEKPRLQLGPDVMQKMIRCIYKGTSPPQTILARATRCYRIPDPSTDDWNQRDRQMRRRMSMVAAMKLILTYNSTQMEQQAMEQFKTENDDQSVFKQQAPYNCGALLAILEAIQRRASSSGRGVNTTLVDRFYGSASTAPASVFANLISMATKAHLPKLRRENKEFFKVRHQEESININDLLTEVCDKITTAGGFPPPLKPEQQAEFALGFYHVRAFLTPPHTPKKQTITSNTEQITTGGKS